MPDCLFQLPQTMSATITASDVNKLRQMTGAGLMDCKKALTETGGDFEAAIDYLRKKGQKVAEKRADRDATEGVAIAQTNAAGDFGIAIRLSSETDFVAKNEEFVGFAQAVADAALQNKPADLSALLALPLNGGATIGDRVTEMVGKIGEKIEVAEYAHLSAPCVIAYIHLGNKIGVLAGFNESSDAVSAIGRDVAMQIAAMSPIAVDEDGVPESIKERELAIGREKAAAEGKPEAMLDKIAEGTLRKWYKENTLLNQAFVKDGSKSVAQALQGVSKDLKVTSFFRLSVGG
jgi:elongation factor Ts